MKKSLEKAASIMKQKDREEIRLLKDSEIDDILYGLSVEDKIRCLKAHFNLQMRYPQYLYKKYRRMIIQFYMNARTTACGALGHSKAENNHFFADKYLEMMKEFELPKPEDKLVWIFGDFNGPGSR